jgi:thiamine-monophosphate kinase
VDTFTEGVHFFPGTDPAALGHKALAVNLSDLAASGAQPLACLLALSLPSVDPVWLGGFSGGLLALARAFDCPLIGGDTTRSSPGGGISVTITVFGSAPDLKSVLRRQGAAPGDVIWVSGAIGAAALAVAARQDQGAPQPKVTDWLGNCSADQLALAGRCLDWPSPRVDLGLALRGLASACIDISDGLLADLSHLLLRSGRLGASLVESRLPLAQAVGALPEDVRRRLALRGGDDYELCFTAPASQTQSLQQSAEQLSIKLTPVGVVEAQAGIRLLTADGGSLPMETHAYEHFH